MKKKKNQVLREHQRGQHHRHPQGVARVPPWRDRELPRGHRVHDGRLHHLRHARELVKQIMEPPPPPPPRTLVKQIIGLSPPSTLVKRSIPPPPLPPTRNSENVRGGSVNVWREFKEALEDTTSTHTRKGGPPRGALGGLPPAQH